MYYKRRKRRIRPKKYIRRRPTRFLRTGINRALNWDNRVYRYKQRVILSQVTMSSAAITNVAYSFKLSDLDQQSTFTNLYDQYKFSWVKLEFIPVNTSVQIAATGTPSSIAQLPMCCMVIDYDDATALSTRGDYFQYQNCKFKRMTSKFTASFKPHMAVASYSGAFTSYANKLPEWIDCNSTGVLHYGVKFLIDQAPANMNTYAAYDVIATYWIAFRNVR